ncbi:MAG: cation diffusion facilitator family transporter [Chloroflexota bacterium]
MTSRHHLTRFAWLSIATACLTISLKAAAYFLTGSVGLLSDALESGVNLVAAVLALVVLTVALRPPDADHAYGHDKAEYFSAGAEGTMILIAALTIAATAVRRLLFPHSLQQLDLGLLVSLVASLLNFGVARVLLQAGRHYQSITLQADAQHLLTDVWTSAGVLAGVAVVAVTGRVWLDPLIGLLAAAYIVRAGYQLVRQAVLGLMDTALPAEEVAQIEAVLRDYEGRGVRYHALRTRRSGPNRFMSVHIQVPGTWTVQAGHSLLEEVETELRRLLAPASILTHLESLEDPRSWQDIELLRGAKREA